MMEDDGAIVPNESCRIHSDKMLGTDVCTKKYGCKFSQSAHLYSRTVNGSHFVRVRSPKENNLRLLKVHKIVILRNDFKMYA